MKIKGFIIVMLLGVLLVGSLACLLSGAKPAVGDIPQGWYLSNEEPYGTYKESDGTVWGLIEYSDSEGSNFVQIYYGDVPSELEEHEADRDALIARAELESKFLPDETGTMIVSGQIAGYTKMYDPDLDRYDMDIVFVLDSGCIDIWARYDATSEAEVMSIIDSISV